MSLVTYVNAVGAQNIGFPTYAQVNRGPSNSTWVRYSAKPYSYHHGWISYSAMYPDLHGGLVTVLCHTHTTMGGLVTVLCHTQTTVGGLVMGDHALPMARRHSWHIPGGEVVTCITTGVMWVSEIASVKFFIRANASNLTENYFHPIPNNNLFRLVENRDFHTLLKTIMLINLNTSILIVC
jgi:hypothetical protein